MGISCNVDSKSCGPGKYTQMEFAFFKHNKSNPIQPVSSEKGQVNAATRLNPGSYDPDLPENSWNQIAG